MSGTNHVLDCPRFTESHNAEAIFGLIVEIIEQYRICQKIYFIGANNGANIARCQNLQN